MSSKNLLSPYSNQELEGRVYVPPDQINSNLYLNLKRILKKKLEGKCNKYGYINKIFKITKYSNGLLEAENLSGSVVFNVKYLANICYLINNTEIIVKVDKINKEIKTSNGPIFCIIKFNDISEEKFKKNSKGDMVYRENEKEIELGDHLRVLIINSMFSSGEYAIASIGIVLDFATEYEVEKYYKLKDEYIEDTNIENIKTIEELEIEEKINT